MSPDKSIRPTLRKNAFHGLLGEIVRLIEPQSEADPAGLLLQGLVAFGNVIGRSAYFTVESDKHYANLNAVLVGETSNGRKGTSWGRVNSLYSSIDPDWKKNCVKSGLSSGEGLIWHVRDATITLEDDSAGNPKTVTSDQGIKDKRLLLVETEFASLLKVMTREGNTLSAVIRNAWDTGDLSTLTKNQAAHATNAHVSILAHVTKADLDRYLGDTEAANGFGNRFLWASVTRSKKLPDGGQIKDFLFEDGTRLLRESVEFAHAAGEIKRSPEAARFWERLYAVLTQDRYGLFGAITGRAAPLVMRLALIYALIDKCTAIKVCHLEAAVAVWKYCDDSCRFIFGDFLGDPLADEILDKLRDCPNGLSRTAISIMFNRNKSSAVITKALNLLRQSGLATVFPDMTGDGRPAEIWVATAMMPGNEFNE